MALAAAHQATLEAVVARLRETLGEDLESLLLYGSAVRDDRVEATSDLNLLILLSESGPREHLAIGEAIRGAVPRIEPFILGRPGFERSLHAFAVKFLSIGRHYRVLHGSDPLAGLDIPLALRRFLAEQALRNLRLRSVHAYVTHGGSGERYARWLIEVIAPLFVALSEAPRLESRELADAHADRVPALDAFYGGDAGVLRELLELRARPRPLPQAEADAIHARLFALLDRAVRWMEARWPAPRMG